MGSGGAGQGSYTPLARPPAPSFCPGRVLLEAPNARVGAKHATWRLSTSFNLRLRRPVYIPGARPSAGAQSFLGCWAPLKLGTPYHARQPQPSRAKPARPGAQLGRSAGRGGGRSEEAIRGLRTLRRTGTFRTLDAGPGRAPQAAIASGLSKPPFPGIQREHKLTRNSSAPSSGRGERPTGGSQLHQSARHPSGPTLSPQPGSHVGLRWASSS